MKKLPNITGLRFILASLVIIFHFSEFLKNRGLPYYDKLDIFYKGTEAVYVFFTLSGFLIIRNLLKEKNNSNTIDLRKFYRNRILRIAPLYYIVLIFGLIYYNFIIQLFGYSIDEEYNPIIGIFLGFTFFANILSTYNPGGIIEVLWSIAIEEQFYLIIAPLFIFLKKENIIKFLIAFSFIYLFIYHIDNLEILRKFRLLFFYFTAGGILSYISLFIKIKINFIIKFFILFFFILLLTTNIFIENLNDFFYHFLCMIIFSCGIYILTLKSYKLLNNKYIIYLGEISYGIYMYHAIVFQIIGLLLIKVSFLSPITMILLSYFSVFLITIILSSISYRYFEKPFLKLKYK
ncbi:acyltransferase [Chishuiella sp.]|uniref:acyltransferase family protein n=1 Tax=Chishuiella sp. TaxID=1969467 RepID=UPI0028A94D3A|nr:acyltransferase [Chishuiella sp.]